MRYHALATDFDGTIAHDGAVDDATVTALRTLRDSGRKLIMVTGRELEELLAVFPQVDLFELLVVENGALLYDPQARKEEPIAPPPPPKLIEELRRRNVPISVGRSIVATVEPHEQAALEAIRETGVEWHVIFNKGAVMILPSGVNKATGLAPALYRLELEPETVVGVGDAENDHAFLQMCGLSVAVGNALPSVKEAVDLVTEGARGIGVQELIEHWLANDLADVERKAEHHPPRAE